MSVKSKQMSLEDVAWRLGSENSRKDNSQKLRQMRLLSLRVIQEELSTRQRQVLYAYFFEGKKMTEIAMDLDVNKSTVSRTVARGVRNLRTHLKYCSLR